jgi:hypothetical protein
MLLDQVRLPSILQMESTLPLRHWQHPLLNNGTAVRHPYRSRTAKITQGKLFTETLPAHVC